jgi:hypothetical protein
VRTGPLLIPVSLMRVVVFLLSLGIYNFIVAFIVQNKSV